MTSSLPVLVVGEVGALEPLEVHGLVPLGQLRHHLEVAQEDDVRQRVLRQHWGRGDEGVSAKELTTDGAISFFKTLHTAVVPEA